MKLNLKNLGITTFLKLVALTLIVSTFFKSIIDVDRTYDTWWYHLPFAARIWQIVPAELYLFAEHEKHRFDGFPLLAEFGQGFFWFIFGHVQAANLVSFLSLVFYIYFLRIYCQVPLYLSTLALLAIPVVQIHATSCYVDLLGNICLSILIMITYLLYTKKEFLTKRILLVILIFATGAANTKFQLIPLVFFILCFIIFKIILLIFRKTQENKKHYKWLITSLPTIFLGVLLIFATPLKNTIFYGNPFYPVRLEIGGIVLNYKESIHGEILPNQDFKLKNINRYQINTISQQNPSYKTISKIQKWIFSTLEIKKAKWSISQGDKNRENHRMGGFFGAYVIFNLVLLGYLFFRNRCNETLGAIILVLIMSVVASLMPVGYKLRFYMYWMISLVSLNLYLVSRLEQLPKKPKFINTKTLAVICLAFLIFVLTVTKANYIRPIFYTLDKHIENRVNREILEQIDEDDKICLIRKQPNTLLYTSKFQQQLNYSYSIRSASLFSECGTRKIIK